MIYGKLVKLRAVEPEDLPKAVEGLNDLEVSVPMGAHYFGTSLLGEQHWYEQIYLKQEHQLVSMVIEDLATGERVGHCGYNKLDWKNRKATVGIFVRKEHWGKGFGKDTLMTLCHFAFAQLNMQKVQLFVFATNEQGIRVYEKCGFQKEVHMQQAAFQDGQYVDDYLMGVLVEEFIPIYEKYMGSE